MYIEHLPVEEVQMGIQPSGTLPIIAGGHWPAPVMIMSGIAASAAARMITK
jgi:hypothetical protein